MIVTVTHFISINEVEIDTVDAVWDVTRSRQGDDMDLDHTVGLEAALEAIRKHILNRAPTRDEIARVRDAA